MSDEGEIRGDLFKREEGIEPTTEQIEAKKQELISKLPTPDEMRKRTFRDT